MKTEQEETTSVEETTMNVPVREQLLILGIIMLLIFGAGYAPTQISKTEEKNTTEDVRTFQAPNADILENPVNTEQLFSDLSIRAEAAYVWDVRAQRALYKKNPDSQLPLASITKLMTALVANELLEQNESIPVTASAILQEGNSGFHDGETFTREDLLNLTLLSSSNDGAFAIAASAGALITSDGDASTFVEAMNIRAKELGLTQTYFRNPTGLDISETESGAYGSARDVTFLFEHILTEYPGILVATTEQSATIANNNGETHQAENTNPIVDRIPGLIGSKTGYTDLAGGNLAIAFDVAFNRPIIVVVLGSTRSGRFDDVLTLVDRTEQAFIAEE